LYFACLRPQVCCNFMRVIPCILAE
jgi:hypothetical protein